MAPAPKKSLADLGSLGGLVYSTDTGRMCPDCRQPIAQCVCKELAKAAAVPAGDGIVRVSRETKGRGGKAVTLVKGACLVFEEEVDSGLDEGGSREGIEEIEVDEGVAVVFGGVRLVGEVYEVMADAEAGD